jgi:hypothetical protein
MTSEEQLDLWVMGKPIHNEESGECCPDFSCCDIDLLAPLDERIAFKNANEGVRISMLGTFLGKLLESKGHQVVTLKDVLIDAKKEP